MKTNYLVSTRKLIFSNLALIAILMVTFFIRVPSLFEPLWVDDEAIYLTIGQKILHGGVMYLDIFDHKTPGIYYLAAATIKFLGASLWSFHFMLMIWVLVSLVIFYFLAKKMFSEKIALLATFFLALLTSTPLLEGNTVNSEILTILPITIGILFGLDKRLFLSGIFFSIAFLFKFPAIFDFLAFFIFATLVMSKENYSLVIKALSKLVLGFLLPFTLTVLYFLINGALGKYLYSIFYFNVGYVNYNNHFIIENGLLIIKAIPLLLIICFFVYKTLINKTSNKKIRLSLFDFLIIWLFFSFYGAVFAGRPYEHYLIQTAPAFSLIAAASFFQKNISKIGLLVLAFIVILAFSLRFRPSIPSFYYPIFFRYVSSDTNFESYAGYFKPEVNRNYNLASFLKGCEKYSGSGVCEETRTQNTDKLYIFSNAPAIYFLSGLDPASRYINFYHIAESKKIQDEVAKEIIKEKPRYILIEKSLEKQFPKLEDIVSSSYNLSAFYENTAIYKISKGSSF